MSAPVVLVDAMIIIEAVRTGCWNAITGQRELVTAQECADEVLRGNPNGPGYVVVRGDDIERIRVEIPAAITAARFRLEYASTDALDPGERDLLTLAYGRGDSFQICSCDKAAVRVAHRAGWIDRLTSLEALAQTVGVRPNPSLKAQYTETRMIQWRTAVRLGNPI